MTRPLLHFAVVVLLLLGKNEARFSDEIGCDDKPKDWTLKQKYIQHLVDTVNKPVFPDCVQSSGVVEDYQLQKIGILPRREVFSLFDERNWGEVCNVIELLVEAKTFDEFVKVAYVVRERVNEDLFLFALTVAVLHRPDTRGLHVPRVHDVYPDKFLSEEVIRRIRRVSSQGKLYNQVPIVDASDLNRNVYDRNNELSYYLEDIGLNSHHYHWHALHVGACSAPLHVIKDRQGELFYWMHRQMVNRVDLERQGIGFSRVRAFENWNEPIMEGYTPRLSIVKTGYTYAYRPEDCRLQDLPKLPRSRMKEWSRTIYNSVDLKKFVAQNSSVITLSEVDGINVLGHIVEASSMSPNRGVYGNLHNYAHVIAAKITDARGIFKEDKGVMYDVATSARDPLFYRWHKYIDNIFQKYKDTLPPYKRQELVFNNKQEVHVTGVLVQGQSSRPNVIQTFWQRSLLKVAQGFAFTPKTPVYVDVKHLQHEDFDFIIDVENKASGPRVGLFRIYMSPIYNDIGHLLTLSEQARSIVELDKFVQKLAPGKTTVRRHAADSSVTLPTRTIFGEDSANVTDDHCKCGWPQHLLFPRGSYEGFPVQVFVIVTDWEKDRVEGDSEGCACRDGVSYCGGVDQKYPDRRAMGYPFDRPIRAPNFESFRLENMDSVEIRIAFTGETVSSASTIVSSSINP